MWRFSVLSERYLEREACLHYAEADPMFSFDVPGEAA